MGVYASWKHIRHALETWFREINRSTTAAKDLDHPPQCVLEVITLARSAAYSTFGSPSSFTKSVKKKPSLSRRTVTYPAPMSSDDDSGEEPPKKKRKSNNNTFNYTNRKKKKGKGKGKGGRRGPAPSST